MASNDDRQTRAIESMEKSAKEMVRVMATLNANLVMALDYIKEQIEKDQADTDRLIENLNKATPPKTAEVTSPVPNVFETRDETKFYSPGEDAGGLDSTHYVEKGD